MSDGEEMTANANGIVEIFKTMVRYPGATIQLALIAFGGVGVYYAMSHEIENVHSEVVMNHKEVNAQLEALLKSDADERDKITAVYARGDTRYNQLLAKAAEQDTKLAKLDVNIDWLVRRFNGGSAVPER